MARFRLTVDLDIDDAVTSLMAEQVILDGLRDLRAGLGDTQGLASTIAAAMRARGLDDGTLVLRRTA